MPRQIISILVFLTACIFTAGLSWFAVLNYRAAAPIADDNLRGLALTIASAMEGIAGRDPSLESLASLKNSETAYVIIISESGVNLFHSNPDLIGHDVGDERYKNVLSAGILGETRVSLGTGEQVYEFQAPFHLSGRTCVLRLALHTWRPEAVMRRARFGLALIFSLLAVGWALGFTVYLLLCRQNAQEKQLNRQRELARLGEVGAVLVHEVRNPLAGIKGYGQLLEERLPEGRDRDYARLIIRESLRLESLASDLLVITRNDGAVTASCNLPAVIAHIRELLSPQLESADVTLNAAVESSSEVLCSEENMHRVLLNLLTNAIQAMPEGGEIRLSACEVDGMVEISVADNGTGIDSNILPVLFEPFRTSKARGAGLGLAVCRKIVESCGGSICAENAPGGGAIFSVKLPVASIEGSV